MQVVTLGTLDLSALWVEAGAMVSSLLCRKKRKEKAGRQLLSGRLPRCSVAVLHIQHTARGPAWPCSHKGSWNLAVWEKGSSRPRTRELAIHHRRGDKT